MPKENDNIWKNIEKSYYADLHGDDVRDTPNAGDYAPQAAKNRQILNILLLIDVSGSMRGDRIAQVNYALENVFEDLREREDLNANFKIGVMEFSDEANWITAQPVPLEDYAFTQIKAQEWYTYYGKAFLALEKKLHSAEFMNPARGEYFAPLILFITDGEPVDVKEYPQALTVLNNNKWFRKSAKYAIAVGEDAKTENVARVLTQFTGIKENVRYADEGSALCGLIQYITVRASEVQTSIGGQGSDGGRGIFPKVDTNLFSSIFDTE